MIFSTRNYGFLIAIGVGTLISGCSTEFSAVKSELHKGGFVMVYPFRDDIQPGQVYTLNPLTRQRNATKKLPPPTIGNSQFATLNSNVNASAMLSLNQALGSGRGGAGNATNATGAQTTGTSTGATGSNAQPTSSGASDPGVSLPTGVTKAAVAASSNAVQQTVDQGTAGSAKAISAALSAGHVSGVTLSFGEGDNRPYIKSYTISQLNSAKFPASYRKYVKSAQNQQSPYYIINQTLMAKGFSYTLTYDNSASLKAQLPIIAQTLGVLQPTAAGSASLESKGAVTLVSPPGKEITIGVSYAHGRNLQAPQ